MPMIALVNDDRHVINSVSSLLQAEGHVTQTYFDGATALSGLQATPPDVAVCDVSIPGLGGIELLRRLRHVTDMPVIFLTSTDSDIEELIGFRTGADDFIRRPVSSQLLVARINAILRRTQLCRAAVEAATPVIERGRLTMDPDRHACHWDGHPVTLPKSGFRLLQALAWKPGVILTYGALMDVIDEDAGRADKSAIYSRIKRLRKAFRAVDDGFEAIETLFGIGFRFNDT